MLTTSIFIQNGFMLEIKSTSITDLRNVMNLWNNGDVMFYVGFPNGLNINYEQVQKWHQNIINSTNTKHYSIYDTNLGYCGESFYSYDDKYDLASLDIKLHKAAQGKGIAHLSLKNTINELFSNTRATRCYVDPHVDNKKAWSLYKKLGFTEKVRPLHLEESSVYLELTKNTWESLRIEQLSVDDGYLVYDMLQEIPYKEYGFKNVVKDLSYYNYKKWLKERDDWSKGINLGEGKVPETYYYLILKGEFIGLGKLRHYLNDDLREYGGHIGYSIVPSKRGKGYSKYLLRLLIDEAKKINIDKVLLVINNENSRSIKTAISNKGNIIRINEKHNYIEIKT